MSIEQPVHLADFDYRDPAQVAKYAITMKRVKEMDAAWALIETKALALSELKGVAEIAVAIDELERLREAAYPKMDKADSAMSNFLPELPNQQQQ